jgi:hypothetical protein
MDVVPCQELGQLLLPLVTQTLTMQIHEEVLMPAHTLSCT